MNNIKIFDYIKQYHEIKIEILQAIEKVLNSGQLILGPEIKNFESSFSKFLGNEGQSVGVANGTDAIIIALLALGIKTGDEVITVSNTAVPTVSAIRSVGAIPVFCDVDPETALMDITNLAQHFTEKTRAIIPVHLFGNVVDIEKIYQIIDGRDIKIIEDCAQAHGATLRGKMVGTLGDIGTFSFYPTKILGAYGDAGLCYSKSQALVTEMRRIRMYGFEDQYYAEREGINSRLDEVQAAILLVKLKYLPQYLEQRRILANCYHNSLPINAIPLSSEKDVQHAYHQFVVKVPKRDEVRKELAQRGVNTGIHYPYPIHLMRGYSFLDYKQGSLPQTESLANSILSLPIYPELDQESVLKVCTELNNVLA